MMDCILAYKLSSSGFDRSDALSKAYSAMAHQVHVSHSPDIPPSFRISGDSGQFCHPSTKILLRGPVSVHKSMNDKMIFAHNAIISSIFVASI